MIRQLTEKEMRQIYETHMQHDFPKAELKPLEKISRMMGEGRYRVYGMYQEEELLAYAFLVKTEKGDRFLLDFFAVCQNGRGKGTGSRFLNQLYELLKPEVLILEVEDILAARSPEEKEVRTRRIAFYHKNGIRDTSIMTNQYGVVLVVMYRSAILDGEEAEREIFASLDEMYQYVFGEDYRNASVTLYRRP